MIHVIIEYAEPKKAIELARQVYMDIAASGRHTILDAPGEFCSSIPERRLSAAEVLVTARQAHNQPNHQTS